MAQNSQAHSYVQGHSSHTVSSHLRRTAESDAAFLLPHIKKTDHILDVGCGPGTITIGLAQRASEGHTIGLDISPAVLKQARLLADEANLKSDDGPGSLTFQEGNILQRLPFDDATFDIAFASQVFGHLPLPDLPIQAMTEIYRVLKPGGILATRDAIAQHFYPRSLDLDRLWVGNFERAMRKEGGPIQDPTGSVMPTIFRKCGFDVDGGKFILATSSKVTSTREGRDFFVSRAKGQFAPGDSFHKAWLDAGIGEDEVRETLEAADKWAETDDAWYLAVQGEMLGWK